MARSVVRFDILTFDARPKSRKAAILKETRLAKAARKALARIVPSR